MGEVMRRDLICAKSRQSKGFGLGAPFLFCQISEMFWGFFPLFRLFKD
jgi:hypothetical protein